MGPVLISNISFCCLSSKQICESIKIRKPPCHTTHLPADSLFTSIQEIWWAVTLKLWRGYSVEGLEQQFEKNQKTKNGLPFWSPRGTVVVELPKMRQSLRDSEENKVCQLFIWKGQWNRRNQGGIWGFKLVVGWMKSNMMLKCLSCLVYGYSLNLVFLIS